MTKLVLGVLVWSFVHLIPAVAVDFRKNLVDKLGENTYKGIFTLFMILSIYLIISGWKATIPEAAYVAPLWGRHLTALLVLFGFILFFAPYPPNNFKRFIRHPQLTGVALWGIGHLFANGEVRSIALFGGLTAWAIIEMMALNRRDGARVIPDPAPLKNDILLVVIGAVIYGIVAYAHVWLFGVSPFIA
jgi:uncharacterized membrane protein